MHVTFGAVANLHHRGDRAWLRDVPIDALYRHAAIEAWPGTATWDAMAVVGVIARPHGIRGQVVITPLTDFPEERFAVGAEVFAQVRGEVQPVRITSLRFQQDRPVLGLDGVTDRTAAEAWAGRELRVLASARDTDDAKASKIARDIAKAFEEQLTYPGEIKITVVRESRFTEVAR